MSLGAGCCGFFCFDMLLFIIIMNIIWPVDVDENSRDQASTNRNCKAKVHNRFNREQRAE